MKRYKSVFLSFVLIFALMLAYVSFADTGWDFDYDSGSDWGGSSDWGSSDWDSSSNRSSHSHGNSSSWSSHSNGNSSRYGFYVIAFFILVMFFVVPAILNIISRIERNIRISKAANKNYNFSNISKDTVQQYISEDEVRQYIPDFDKIKFINYAFDTYKNLQEAWMNFNYDEMKNNLTDELYNMYKMQLTELEVKNQQNIMQDITFKKAFITRIKKEGDLTELDVDLTVTQRDYVIDSNNKAVLRGDYKALFLVEYNLKFVYLPNLREKNCPNCGAELKAGNLDKCEYCNTKIINNNLKLVIAKKEIIKQTRIG